MHHTLPLFIAGPILRRLTPNQIVLWWISSRPIEVSVECYQSSPTTRLFRQSLDDHNRFRFQVGREAFVYLVNIIPPTPLPVKTKLEYDLVVETPQGPLGLKTLLPELLYPGETRPSFVVKTQLDQVLHGSCRKPHFHGRDTLFRIDELLEQHLDDPASRPALFVMTGDQIYADDVAGPTLSAIHQTVEQLGLYPETLNGASVADYDALIHSSFCYYERDSILPQDSAHNILKDLFFRSAHKPIFTSAFPENHLITLCEMMAMYCLVWSPAMWDTLDLQPQCVKPEHHQRYLEELPAIEEFVRDLPQVRRMMAHLPVYMIFDDHDVTDDWNLTRGWEEAAYGHPVSRRIIGNALISYWLCQGWGNAPQNFGTEIADAVSQCFADLGGLAQDGLIDRFLKFDRWHFTLPTTPKMIVLDTRTKRWWSESQENRPSGLMDWESLSDLQQELLHEEAVMMVSPAPVFGMKLIEAIQRVFTFLGQALMVDAENWMAHPGSANVILNIFKNPKTPKNFVILSGDVHYSFAYDIKIRFWKNSPSIWQITCSGFKNEFPHRLLRWLEPINRWIYSVFSPLNWFTKRRDMIIEARKPEGYQTQEVLNKNGVGLVELNAEGVPSKISILPAEGGEIQFPENQSSS